MGDPGGRWLDVSAQGWCSALGLEVWVRVRVVSGPRGSKS